MLQTTRPCFVLNFGAIYLLTYLLTYLNIVMEWRIDLKKLHVTGFAPLDIVYGVRVIDNVGVIYPFPMLDSLTRLL